MLKCAMVVAFTILYICQQTFISKATSWYTVSRSTPSRSIARCKIAVKLLSSSVNSFKYPPMLKENKQIQRIYVPNLNH